MVDCAGLKLWSLRNGGTRFEMGELMLVSDVERPWLTFFFLVFLKFSLIGDILFKYIPLPMWDFFIRIRIVFLDI